MRRAKDVIRDLHGLAKHGCFNHQERLLIEEAAEMIRGMIMKIGALECEIAARDQGKMDLPGVIPPAAERGPEP